MTEEKLRELLLDFPGVEEGLSYGTPGWRVRGKLFARLQEDEETLVLRVIAGQGDRGQRDMLLEAEPDVFFLTDHYRGHPWVLVRLPVISRARLRAALEEAWRLRAPRSLQDIFDGA